MRKALNTYAQSSGSCGSSKILNIFLAALAMLKVIYLIQKYFKAASFVLLLELLVLKNFNSNIIILIFNSLLIFFRR